MARGIIRILRPLALACLIAGVATAALGGFWIAIGGGAMSIHGWIAMGLGVMGSVGLAWGLMSLAFRSDREGWDAQAGESHGPAGDKSGGDVPDDPY